MACRLAVHADRQRLQHLDRVAQSAVPNHPDGNGARFARGGPTSTPTGQRSPPWWRIRCACLHLPSSSSSQRCESLLTVEPCKLGKSGKMDAMLVDRILPIALERLSTIEAGASFPVLQKCFQTPHKSLWSVIGVITKTSIVRQIANCPGRPLYDGSLSCDDAKCHLLPSRRPVARCVVENESEWVCAHSDCRPRFQAMWSDQCSRCPSAPFGRSRV
jgi:hypothetical protein